MRRATFRSTAYYQFEHLASMVGLVHGVFTRLGGHSRPPWAGLNTGHTVGDDPRAVEANHQLICQALGFDREDIVSPHQVHSATVGIVDARDRGRVRAETDALVTTEPGVLVMLRFADCVPVLLYDPRRRVIGLAHAGWRGTAAGVAQATVNVMETAFGCRPADVIAGIGPSIGPCCYEVGEDVASAFGRAFPGAGGLLRSRSDGHWRADLWAANRLQLAEVGVQRIEVAAICTACRTDEWFSHRAEHCKTGRFAAAIGLQDPGS